MHVHDCAAILLYDSVNIRYALDVSNMALWMTHNPTNYTLILADGPAIYFGYFGSEHVAAGLEGVDEVRTSRAYMYFDVPGRVEETARGVRMRFTPVGTPWRPAHRHLTEVSLVQLAMGVRYFTGVDVRPLRVRFAYPAPADLREHEALFGCPMEFEAPASDMEFSHEDADRPFVHADALVMFQTSADLTAGSPAERRALLAALPCATAIGDRQAAETIFRRLQQAGVTGPQIGGAAPVASCRRLAQRL